MAKPDDDICRDITGQPIFGRVPLFRIPSGMLNDAHSSIQMLRSFATDVNPRPMKQRRISPSQPSPPPPPSLSDYKQLPEYAGFRKASTFLPPTHKSDSNKRNDHNHLSNGQPKICCSMAKLSTTNSLSNKQTNPAELSKDAMANELSGHDSLKMLDKDLIERILAEIVDTGPPRTWDDVAGLEDVKKSLREWVVLPLIRPDLYHGIRSPGKGLLLFGPPGTGKTLIGKCVASHSKATFFSISSSSLTSKWIGDGEKMVRALFAVARLKQPSVIFIDEIDSLLTQRCEGEHEASRRMKTEFLLQFDGMSAKDDEKLLVIGATNRPQQLDEAARRRFTKRIYVPLPDSQAREQILRNQMKKVNNGLTEGQFAAISGLLEGYSGADVTVVCQEAAHGPLRSAIDDGTIETIEETALRPVVFQDFVDAMEQVKSSVSPAEIDHYIEFNRLYGLGGNKRK